MEPPREGGRFLLGLETAGYLFFRKPQKRGGTKHKKQDCFEDLLFVEV